MPTAVLQSFSRDRTKITPTSATATVTHNNSRLYNHSDGKTYEYVGNDSSGNRIYRDARRMRIS